LIAVDTSALLHVAFAEPGHRHSVATLLGRSARLVSAASVVGAQAVLASRAEEPREALDRLLGLLRIEIVAVDAAQVDIARDAYLRFGRASRHPARLHYGDTFAYALARARDVPLAFVGDDFSLTDLRLLRLA
jgi:ribonuclease VapC